ncbi:MAG TPA: DUF2946 family protein [Acetobacteraceae bacterium]|nr:DUF2946 family protein [Acetobacteraceae bacterium]
MTSRRLSSRSWLAASGFAWLVVVLALLGQMAIGALVPSADPAPARHGEMAALMDICHAGMADMAGAPHHHDHHHHTPDCALCPLCVALTLPAALPAPGPELPAPPVLPRRGMAAALPPARGPPAHTALAAYPRGPPVLT